MRKVFFIIIDRNVWKMLLDALEALFKWLIRTSSLTNIHLKITKCF